MAMVPTVASMAVAAVPSPMAVSVVMVTLFAITAASPSPGGVPSSQMLGSDQLPSLMVVAVTAAEGCRSGRPCPSASATMATSGRTLPTSHHAPAGCCSEVEMVGWRFMRAPAERRSACVRACGAQ